MKLLLTGSTGFIGKRLLSHICKDKALRNETIVLSSKPVEGFFTIQHFNYNFTPDVFLNANVSGIEAVVHLGAYIPKKQSLANDIESCTSNIRNTKTLLEQLPDSTKRFIYISSVDVYGHYNNRAISESMQCNPITLYGMSKFYCEKMVEEWCQKNNIIFQILRLGHIYGPGEDDYQKIIPVTIKKVIQNIPPVIHTTGKEMRAFLYIDDCCRAILKSLSLPEYIGPVNIASGCAISVNDIVRQIIGISKKDLNVIWERPPIKGQDIYFNISKMVQYFGNESIDYAKGLREEYAYFLATGKNDDC
jgi:nucleoside-diphosphate-sugar epimerase